MALDDDSVWGFAQEIRHRVQLALSNIFQKSFPGTIAATALRSRLNNIEHSLSSVVRGEYPDVAEDIYLIGRQLSTSGKCLTVRIGEERIPLLELTFRPFRRWRDQEVKVVRISEGARRGALRLGETVSSASAYEVPTFMDMPLARFLAWRSFGRSFRSSGSATANVEVHNTENGWQVVYSPIYVSSQNGLGGPSTPVRGHVRPGRYRFGVAKTSNVLWDASEWSVPASSQIFIPVPRK